MKQDNGINELESWLDSTLNFEKRPVKGIFWLKTMEFLCNRFNNPQNAYLSFHVAGSKGKGSVSCFISSILESAGKTCGLYTSPHILDLRERVSLAHSFFPDEIYKKCTEKLICRVNSIIPEMLPGGREGTWFEYLTLFAFLCFREANVDCAVFETGMGGRLDATNVISPEFCCLTPIELEHCEFLGNTLEKIAAEKAGIIKKGIPVFSSAQKPEVRDVFRVQAAKMQAPLYFIDEIIDSIRIENIQLKTCANVEMKAEINCSKYFSRPLKINLLMPGEFQVWNAALAAVAVKNRFPEISETQIEQGISSAKLPGRFEVAHYEIKGHPLTIVYDGAHTVNSLSFTLKNFSYYFGIGANILFACAADKNVKEMASLICDSQCSFNSIMLTRPGNIKQSNYEDLLKYFSRVNVSKNNKSLKILSGNPHYSQAIAEAIETSSFQNRKLLVCGSFYLVAEVKKYLEKITVPVM
ncbi:MAG: hypothetical protein BKP49_08640 [Treponema sp. CETP13]|nr:MAG: hypothetical protein BKP49_08640 [Treponema sp. CETP13]